MSLAAAIKQIEHACAVEAKAARMAYVADVKALKAVYQAEQEKLAKRERERLKEIERSRVTAIAALQPLQPVRLCDIRSVKREVADGFERKTVSVPRLSFLDGKVGAA